MLTVDIGTRLELIPMDPHCGDISIGLYRQGTGYLVHTYSRREGAEARVEFLRGAMAALGAMRLDGQLLHHRCGSLHPAATRRLFLECAKLVSGDPAAPRPLTVTDKKTGKTIRVTGGPAYTLDASGDVARGEAVAAGLKKLGELDDPLTFPCGQKHDELIGLLLPRALNVRAILREEEATVSRGVLVAPSAQK